MENDTLGGLPVEGVSVEASAETQDSSPESNTQNIDPLKNVKSEMNRKFSKINDQLNQLVQMVGRTQATGSADKASTIIDEESPDYKRYVDARFQEAQKESVKRGQEEAWSKALELFPELNQESDAFDDKFYKMADRFYGSFDLSKDPEAPLKAVKLAALEIGKMDQLAKEKLLRDESRRSRIISEGTNSPKENKQERKMQMNEKGLARIGVKANELEAFIKANKDRYGDL